MLCIISGQDLREGKKVKKNKNIERIQHQFHCLLPAFNTENDDAGKQLI